MTLRVRPTEPADFPHIARLINHYIRNTAVHFGDADVTPEDFEREWRETRDAYPWVSADLDERFAGYAKAGLWRERAAYRLTVETAIYVEDFARGKGVGKALYTRLLEQCKARGFHVAVAGATLPNDASIRLHESVGFQTVGVFREVGRKFNQWHDVIWWQRVL